MKKIALNSLDAFLGKLAETHTVIAPIEKADQTDFTVWSEGAKVRTDVVKTVKSAKGAFFPQIEDMARFHMEGKSISMDPAAVMEEDFVIFGVRACDARSFDLLDRVFLSEPADPFYAARRAHGTIITLACSEMEMTCFCTTFGIDPAEPAGDVTAWIVGEDLCLRANTVKGEKLIASLPDTDENIADEAKERIHRIAAMLPYGKMDLSGFDGNHLMEKFNSPKWADLSHACLGCGTCTFICPTCQCYDVRDYDTGHGIQRYRCWDSCMYSDFTLMAHGTNRPTQLERFRQRFMHKLVYFPSNNEGLYGCVGCGRCLARCPQSINIIKVIKALGVKHDA